jgi:hypothetical protein
VRFFVPGYLIRGYSQTPAGIFPLPGRILHPTHPPQGNPAVHRTRDLFPEMFFLLLFPKL